MTDAVRIEVKGLKELQAAIKKFPQETRHYLKGAGIESARDVILMTPGLGGMGEKTYPPAPSGSRPPAPYYQRGVGMVYKSGPGKASEKLGTQWTVESSDFKTIIANPASYAKWVVGEQQASFMAPIGWKRLFQTAKDKQAQMTAVYNKWVKALLVKIRLM